MVFFWLDTLLCQSRGLSFCRIGLERKVTCHRVDRFTVVAVRQIIDPDIIDSIRMPLFKLSAVREVVVFTGVFIKIR